MLFAQSLVSQICNYLHYLNVKQIHAMIFIKSAAFIKIIYSLLKHGMNPDSKQTKHYKVSFFDKICLLI